MLRRWLTSQLMYDRMTRVHAFHWRSTKLFNYSYANLAGHGSFVLLAISYLEADPLRLRIGAMLGFASMSVFQYYRPKPLWLPLRWNGIFILINLAMSSKLLIERARAETFGSEEEKLYRRVFQRRGVSRLDFLHLLQGAQVRRVKKGERVVKQDQKQNQLCLVLRGQAQVRLNREPIAWLRCHQLWRACLQLCHAAAR